MPRFYSLPVRALLFHWVSSHRVADPVRDSAPLHSHEGIGPVNGQQLGTHLLQMYSWSDKERC